MPTLHGRALSRAELRRRVGQPGQLHGIAAGQYTDGPERGVRYLDLRSGGGLEARVLVDRGFDLGELRFAGVPLSWRSPTGFRAPALHDAEAEDGAGILRSFDGFLVTCGPDHVRGAATGPAAHFGPRRQSVRYPMHGRHAMTPARLAGYGEAGGEAGGEEDDADGVLWCAGEVRQAMLYGESLTLRRRVAAAVGGAAIEIADRIENDGFHATPHMLLYHLNLGFPLLDEDAELLLPGWPTAPGSPAGAAALRRQGPPAGPDAPDEILDLAAPSGGGPAACALVNDRLGLAVEVAFDGAALPHLQVWRNLADGMYVLAVEPATVPFRKRDALEAEGAVRFLAPGEAVSYRLRIAVHAGAPALAALRGRLAP